jgi:nucleolar GTP-binding protein
MQSNFQYNFKAITQVPTSKDLINVTLSKTQRKTPTVVHPKYAISRIRSFYMRKVKFTCETIHERFQGILDGFPKLDDIHPFFSDLINVIYDKDHYKLALGHINTARHLVDNIAKDYVRFIKYGDSLYRCKMLKRAALGRMVTCMRKLGPSLSFLDEVRKHLARMPSIDPTTRTLLVTGFPNVGKTSFVNQITNVNGDVQAYPFTTQSLYVGHTDFNYTPWQIIDSPGLLDTPLSNRTTIEMQSITALAHLKACILFFIDISETGGYAIEEQVSLFQSIKALFVKKPFVIVMTKVDLKKFEELTPEHQELLLSLANEHDTTLINLSNQTGQGVADVKETACRLLINFRKDMQTEHIPSKTIKREEEFLRGIYVALPKGSRTGMAKPPCIPEEIIQNGRIRSKKPSLKEIQEAMGGAGVFNFPLQEHLRLADDSWKYDVQPEIMDGKNVWDFYDTNIDSKMAELEKEEEMLLLGQQIEEEPELLDPSLYKAYEEMKSKRAIAKIQHKMIKKNRLPRKKNQDLEVVEHGLQLGKPAEAESVRSRFNANGKRKGRALDGLYKETMEEMEVEDEAPEKKNERLERRAESKLREFSRSRTPGAKKTLTENDKNMVRLKHKIQKEWKNQGLSHESDRVIAVKLPKHLYTGVRSNGKTDRR